MIKIGTRVKLVRPHNTCNLDLTGTVTEIFPERKTDPAEGRLCSHPIDCNVIWDRAPTNAKVTYTHTSRLEPLLPPPDLAAWDSEEMPCNRDGTYKAPNEINSIGSRQPLWM